MIIQSIALRMKHAMKRPFETKKGLSTLFMFVWYIDSIIGAKHEAASKQTAT